MLAARKKWMFDLETLEKGDILFTRSPYVGTGIAKITKGRFGHVMIYLGDTVIHADTKGVWSKNPQRILLNERTRLAAFRLKKPLSSDHLRRIENFARSRIGSVYSIPQAINSIQTRSGEIAERYELHTQFCSRLVAQSFAEVGVNLVADFDFCTPNQIADSDLLEEVENCVIQAGEVAIQYNRRRDYNMELQVETYRWLSRVRALTEKHDLKPVRTQSEVGEMLLKNPHLDAEVCGYVQATKYMDYFDIDMRVNPWRYNPARLMEALLSTASFTTSLAKERNINESTLRRFEKQRLKAIQNARSNLGYFALELMLYTKLVSQMHMWKETLTTVSTAHNALSGY